MTQYFNTVESTCSEYGYIIYKCSICGDEKTISLNTKPDHDYELIERVESTCTSKGHETYKCKNCDATKTVSIYYQAHNYEYVKTVAPTCTTMGYDVERCTYCGREVYDNYQPTTEHNYAKTGTTVKNGIEYNILTCKNCGATKEEISDEFSNVTDPYMKRCYQISKEYIENLGAIYDPSRTEENSSWSDLNHYYDEWLDDAGGLAYFEKDLAESMDVYVGRLMFNAQGATKEEYFKNAYMYVSIEHANGSYRTRMYFG